MSRSTRRAACWTAVTLVVGAAACGTTPPAAVAPARPRAHAPEPAPSAVPASTASVPPPLPSAAEPVREPASPDAVRFTKGTMTGPAYDAAFARGDHALATWCPEPCPWGDEQRARLVVWSLDDLRVARDFQPFADDMGEGVMHGMQSAAGGARLVTSTHNQVQLWDTTTWSLVSAVDSFAIYGGWQPSPSGAHLALSNVFGGAALVDATTGKTIRHVQLHPGVASVSAGVLWSADARTVVLEGNGVLRGVRLEGGSTTLSAPAGGGVSELVTHYALSRDGTWLVAVEGRRVTLFAARGATKRVLVDAPAAPDPRVSARAAFSPSADRLAILDVDGSLRIWDLDAAGAGVAREVEPGGKAWRTGSLVWRPDGRFLAWIDSDDGAVYVWEGESATTTRLEGPARGMADVVWSRRRGLLARTVGNTFDAWDVERQERLARRRLDGRVSARATFSEDERFVAIAAGDVHVVRIADGKSLVLRTRGIAKSRTSAALASDGGWTGDALFAREIESMDGSKPREQLAAELARTFFAR